MENHTKYSREVMPDAEESLSKIADQISNNSVVLDVGCSSGMMGQFLVKNKACVVDGVDIDVDALANCHPIYRKIFIKNLETDELVDSFAQQSYDFIVVADVIEHLNNPNKLLEQLRLLLKPHGVIIFSVPNITHLAASLELLTGSFSYSQNGLLDNTHLRFYSLKTLIAKFLGSGLYSWKIDAIHKQVTDTEFSDRITRLFPKDWINAFIESRSDALVYQWIISTKLYPSLDKIRVEESSSNTLIAPLFTSLLYWKEVGGQFSESQKIIGLKKIQKDSKQFTVDFRFHDIPLDRPIQLRIDPISDSKTIWIKRGIISDADNSILWEWEYDRSNQDLSNAQWLDVQVESGRLLSSNNDDPQWYPNIPMSVLEKITNKSKLSLVICDDCAIIDRFLIASLDELTITVEDNLAKITSALSTITDLEERMRLSKLEAEQQLVELRSQLLDLHSSRSWKITAPMRKIGRLLR